MKTSLKTLASSLLLVLLVVLVAAASFWAFRQIETAAEMRKHRYIVIGQAEEVLAHLTDAETGQRGYALTGDEAFLKHYLAVRDTIPLQLEELRRLTTISSARAHLDALTVLSHAKLAELAQGISLRRDNKMAAVLAQVKSGQGKRLMDSIRAETAAYVKLERDSLSQHQAALQLKLRDLFFVIVAASLFMLLLALSIAWLIYRQSRHQIENLIHQQTQHSLMLEQQSNQQLQQSNLTLQKSEQNLEVTLNSIGDAVIATDAAARVTSLNPMAEKLTGWAPADAIGRPINEIFHIINKATRQPCAIPVDEALARGTTQGLANHTVLIARDGSEHDIADSCAPIRCNDGQMIGAVLVFRDVTAEYATQQALADSSALVRAILDTVVDGIITIHASSGIIARTNQATERMFGYAAADLVGRNFSALIPELRHEQHDDSLEYYSASAEASAAGRAREVLGRHKDGSSFPLEIAVGELLIGGKHYYTGVLRDISARKKTEEALQKAGALQSAIFNSANFSSIATDSRGVIQIFNVGAERLLGYSAADVINKITPADISDSGEVIARAMALSIELSTPIAPGFEALVFKASRGIEDIYELTHIRKDGTRFPAVVSVTALRDANEAIIGYLLIGTDNTARQQIETERERTDSLLRYKNVELEQARVAAEKANLAKSEFLSSMSHELRTPLNAILGFAQIMESGSPPPPPAQKRNLEKILKSGWYLLELINEILDLAMIESGKVVLSNEPVSLAEVLRECRTMVEPQSHKRGLHMMFAQLETPYFVTADRTRLKQVFVNLLSNAIKYNRPGGVITMEYSLQAANSIRVGIRDGGAGLSKEQLAQLFQPFNRLGRETGSEEGTGIGLVVTKRLIEVMGGRIGVESSVGVGSVFWIELSLTSAPLLEFQDDRQNTPAAPSMPDGKPRRTLLYVEDNPANLELVEQLVARRPDLHLISAGDGELGVQFARMYQPEVILMDINLPGISGIEALQMLRAAASTAHIPVIALSANALPHDIERALAAGFFRYLTKPIKVNEFMDTLDLALQFTRNRANPATPANIEENNDA